MTTVKRYAARIYGQGITEYEDGGFVRIEDLTAGGVLVVDGVEYVMVPEDLLRKLKQGCAWSSQMVILTDQEGAWLKAWNKRRATVGAKP